MELTRYTDEQIAQVVHDANRRLQILQNDPAPSQPWECEDEHTRASAVAGVRAARDGMTPRQLHDAWAAFKKAEGWVYGPVKNPQARTHPCLVAYDDLPPGQRDKDRLFVAIVNALTQEMY